MQGSFLNFYFSVFRGEVCQYITERSMTRTGKELNNLLNPQTAYGVGYNIKGDVNANSFVAWTRWGRRYRHGYLESWSMSTINGVIEEVNSQQTRIAIILSANYYATILYVMGNLGGATAATYGWANGRDIDLIVLGVGMVVVANSLVWLWAYDSKFFLKKTFEEGMELKPPVPYI